MESKALYETSRSAVLRRPQSGTPEPGLSSQREAEELVGDYQLLELGLDSAMAMLLCGALLRTQIQTYRRTRHIISLADEFALRKVRRACSTERVPNIYCRCMRCGCIALLLDWMLAVDQVREPIFRPRKEGSRLLYVVSREFLLPCTGNEKAENGLFLLNMREEER